VAEVGDQTTIRPPTTWPSLGLGELWRYRRICFVLAHRSLKAKYRQTAVGVSWAVIQPLILAVVFSIFFGLLARVGTDEVPFALFYFAGLWIWTVMARLLSEGANSVLANGILVTRVYLPRIYLPASVALATLVDLAVNALVLLLMMLVYGYLPGPEALLLPVLVVLAYAAFLGVTFWLAALNVQYRDVGIVLPLLIQVWFFATPLIYPASLVPPEWTAIYYLNPMALVITGTRAALLGTPPAPIEAWPIGFAMGALMLITGYLVFRRREALFADLI
jgi:lipopolysaccharide transport system permease protein